MRIKRPYIIRCLLILLSGAFTLTGCDVHEFPEISETTTFVLRLRYETGMTVWEHTYDGNYLTDKGLGGTYDNARGYGIIRYIVRAYPHVVQQRTMPAPVREFIFFKDISEGYDREFSLELPTGNYDIMVWSDLMEQKGLTPFYNADDFAEISLQGSHKGNDDFRDAFRGTNSVTLTTDIMEHVPDTLDIAMQRPLAKYEIITTDLEEFVDKELELMQQSAQSTGTEAPARVNIDNYKVVFYYSGFMPDTYNMNTDKPVDSSTGVLFESKLSELGEKEASLGFDYLFVNGHDAGVSVQVGLYDDENRQISLTDPIDVPLRRNRHTILRGSFLMRQASGGITINPGFEGEHNIIIE